MTQQIQQLIQDNPETSSIVFPEQLSGRIDPSVLGLPVTYHPEWYVMLLRADGSAVGRWTLLES
jgi:hypothetical protein